ncbi:hypothetical protein [Streptomyces endophytica]|uniref:Uncharacterized protein n=1 Tax=Streptomyces endophytica TaxID=2991496 RepID=A0ABY6PLM9_9ACTN|nr:hypothetical protein [Streptomyces endophytica]UZJ34267.1 hypothetical protein OJ254_03695 [Streptomyces endophytica]
MRFEIMRLDDVDGTAVDSTVVDAASVNRIVQQAAATGQRIYIARPTPSPVNPGRREATDAAVPPYGTRRTGALPYR